MKKGLIITMLLISVVLTGCGTKGEIAKKEEEKQYFDFAHTEIVSYLEENFINFTHIANVDCSEPGEQLATFTAKTNILTTGDIKELVHYRFVYDNTVNKVISISFNMDRNLTLTSERYLYHINTIAEYIEPGVNTDDIIDTIEKGFAENNAAIYEGENFDLFVSRSEEFFDAYFAPIIKGE